VTLAIGVLASGAGTNFDAIASAIAAGTLDAEVRVLVCNRPHAAVISKATARGIRIELIDHRSFDSREAFDRAVADVLERARVELIAMAGFDRVVSRELISRFPARILNIHPALLPAFRGAGAQAEAAKYGVTIAGATVHVVDEDVDHGPIVIQAAVPVAPGEDPETVRNRILTQEHRIYPYAIQLFAQGRVRIVGRQVRVDGRPAPADECLISPPLPS
jgi:phosphoribosylglycinamide formyltransferase-1